MFHFLSAMVDGPGYLPLGWTPNQVLQASRVKMSNQLPHEVDRLAKQYLFCMASSAGQQGGVGGVPAVVCGVSGVQGSQSSPL